MVTISREHCSLVCDIGSGSVGAGLFLLQSEAKPFFLGGVRVPLKTPTHFAPLQEQQILTLTAKACEVVLSSVFPESSKRILRKKSIDSTHFFLASPWHIARSSIATLEKEKTFTVDTEMLDTLLSEKSELFRSELMEQHTAGSKEESVRLIERSLTDIRLNGYPTSSPLGKHANQAECALYMSAVSESLFQGLEGITHQIHSKAFTIHSFPLAYFRTINRMFRHGKHCLLFDIAGESTDICLIQQGMLEAVTSVPIGKNTLIRSIMERHSVTSEIASSFLHAYNEGALHPEVKNDLESLVHEYKMQWSEKISKTTSSSAIEQSPERFLVCDDDFSEIAKQCVRGLSSPSHPRLFHLSQKEFSGHTEQAKHALPDPFLVLEALSLRLTPS